MLNFEKKRKGRREEKKVKNKKTETEKKTKKERLLFLWSVQQEIYTQGKSVFCFFCFFPLHFPLITRSEVNFYYHIINFCDLQKSYQSETKLVCFD
jgi:hypothetical protein